MEIQNSDLLTYSTTIVFFKTTVHGQARNCLSWNSFSSTICYMFWKYHESYKKQLLSKYLEHSIELWWKQLIQGNLDIDIWTTFNYWWHNFLLCPRNSAVTAPSCKTFVKFPNFLRFQAFSIRICLLVTHEAIQIQGLSYQKSNWILLMVNQIYTRTLYRKILHHGV